MIGKYRVIISNGNVKYDFTIERKITIIRGNSATGKTTLVELIREASVSRYINLTCDVQCLAATWDDDNWESFIKRHPNSILFFDEDCDYVKTKQFAKVVKDADCYLVIVNRNNLSTLPYSINEIYEIKESKRYGTTAPVENKFVRKYQDMRGSIVPSKLFIEDSNSGYVFLKAAYSRYNCVACNGNANVKKYVLTATDKSLFIVDGAAFGAYIDDLATIITQKQMMGVSVYVFAPESFEWCILRSRLFYDKCKKQLDETYNYADSKEYGSWEQYYTDLLIELTRNTPAAYTKSNLNEFYLGDNSIKAIKEIYDCIDEGLANMSLF